MLAIQKRPDEQSPCPIITAIAPDSPHELATISPHKTNPMWATEEYAIKDFISLCRKQINLTISPPRAPNLTQTQEILRLTLRNKGKVRTSP